MAEHSGDRRNHDARAVKIAGVALNFAMKNDMQEAARYVGRLNHSDGLITAIIAWIDTYMARLHPDHEYGSGPIRMEWMFTPTGEQQTADDVDVSMRWAGRMIAARANDDEETFYALLRSLPEGKGLGGGVMALLHAVAHSLNNPQIQPSKS